VAVPNVELNSKHESAVLHLLIDFKYWTRWQL